MNAILIIIAFVIALFAGSYIVSSIQQKRRNDELNLSYSSASAADADDEDDEYEEDDDEEEDDEDEDDEEEDEEDGDDDASASQTSSESAEVGTSGGGYAGCITMLLLLAAVVFGVCYFCCEDLTQDLAKSQVVEKATPQQMTAETVYANGEVATTHWEVVEEGVKEDGVFYVVIHTIENNRVVKRDTLYHAFSTKSKW